MARPSPNGASGFFRVEKFGNRWMFVTPAGNAFWMVSVQNIGDYFYPGTVKYPGGKSQWATQVRRRLKSWGFNTLGEFGAGEVWFGNTDPMPFVVQFRPANNALRNTGQFVAEAVKEVYGNIPTSVYDGYRGILIDAFDPKYLVYAQAFFESDYNLRWIPGGASNPWLIGYATEDGDEWFGVTVGDAPDTNVVKPHPAWAFLVSKDPMSSSAHVGSYGQQTYTDTTNYSKRALRDFLKGRYNNDLNALNAAWGGLYTSWDHAGGWGVGTGLLDEGGQHKWVCSTLPCSTGDWNTLNSMRARARADMDAFLEAFAGRLASVAMNAIRAKDKNHLIFSPDTMNQWGYVTRRPVLRGVAKWFDVLHVGYQEGPVFSIERKAAPGRTYDVTSKPMIYWIGFQANQDSAMFACRAPFGVDSAPTQAARGRKYADYLDNLLNAQGANGDYVSVGIDWWGWMDQHNECTNWGLVTPKDNAYDGREARIQAGKDPWGYAIGGEHKDYGDFLSAVRNANATVYKTLFPTDAR